MYNSKYDYDGFTQRVWAAAGIASRIRLRPLPHICLFNILPYDPTCCSLSYC